LVDAPMAGSVPRIAKSDFNRMTLHSIL